MYSLVCDDILHWAETYSGPQFHAMLCDPPYGLSNEGSKSTNDSILSGLTQIVFPDLYQLNARLAEDVDLMGIPLDGSPLSRRKMRSIVESWVSVPERAINLQRDSQIGKIEINTSSIASTDSIPNTPLGDKGYTEESKFLGDYILDLRDTIDLARRDILSSDLTEFGAGEFCVPIFPIFLPNCANPLSIFLLRLMPKFADFVGFSNNSTSQSQTATPVVTNEGAVNTLMLRFDLRRRTLELFATYRASESYRLQHLGRPKLIGTEAGACCLPSEFEPIRVSVVLPLTNRTCHGYFHLWLRRNFWNLLEHIIPHSGFMGKTWDSTVPSREVWTALGKHLLPGGFVMAFGGCRTYHRMVCAFEDAGFIIHPVIAWINSMGFPKATRIDTQVDRAAGTEPEVIGVQSYKRGVKSYQRASKDAGIREYKEGLSEDINTAKYGGIPITQSNIELGRVWSGHRYGLQALKPAVELICVAQKPYEGKPVDCITRTGAGALWIDGGRIRTNGESVTIKTWDDGSKPFGNGAGHPYTGRQETLGRWPANLCLQHLPECKNVGARRVKGSRCGSANTEPGAATAFIKYPWKSGAHHGDVDGLETVEAWDCSPDCPVRLLDEQSGVSTTKYIEKPSECNEEANTWGGTFQRNRGARGYSDTGSAARFFYNSHWSYEEQEITPFFYSSKSSRTERESGLLGVIPCSVCGGLDTLTHKDDKGNDIKCHRCLHPTVKPISLCKYLATLLLPPDAYAPRRILVPFAGVASEMIGCILSGWNEIIGIEREQEYVTIGEARLKFWSTKYQKEKSDPQQLSLV